MAKTLQASKIKLEQDLKNAFEKAAKEAYMTQFSSNEVTEAKIYDPTAKLSYDKQAKDYAKALADTLSGDMAKAIYDFVKEIGIMVTVPPSVVAPSGPCTGSIPMTSFTII